MKETTLIVILMGLASLLALWGDWSDYSNKATKLETRIEELEKANAKLADLFVECEKRLLLQKQIRVER